MKKLMVLASAAGLAGVAMGVSSGVVGYINQGELPVGYSMIGTQFVTPGATDTTVNLLDYIKGDFTAAKFRDRTTAAPQIAIYTEGEGYARYYYLTEAYDEDSGDDVEGWADGRGDLVSEINVNASTAVWVICPAQESGAITFSGQVATAADISQSCVAGYTMVSSPYPADLTLGSVTFGSTLTPSLWRNRNASAPQIAVYTEGEGYSRYYYVTDAYDEDANDDVEGWANVRGDLVVDTDVLVPAGKGFWVILPTGSENVTVEFENPLN
ncbi:MAG: hypothetical protein IJ802_06060 [Kiritimatiellae bacterium]|nr:hypothetical protein [Kiritimatiellia bacterium]